MLLLLLLLLLPSPSAQFDILKARQVLKVEGLGGP